MIPIRIDNAGNLSMIVGGRTCIEPSPVGILCAGGIAYKPISAKTAGDEITLVYPHGTVVCRGEQKSGYWKLTLLSVPENTDGFVFGPWKTAAGECGELIGAAWFDDGAAVCIQGLCEKVIGGDLTPSADSGAYGIVREDRTDGYALGGRRDAAVLRGDGVSLQCSVYDRRSERIGRNPQHGTEHFIIEAAAGSDAVVDGASVALLYADDSAQLLDVIGQMEIAEGLPHPTYFGSWAKTDLRTSSLYLVIDGTDVDDTERIAAAKRAGIHAVYFCDVIGTWGHFEVNRINFPGGREEVAGYSEHAYRDGILIGAHSLTNFIHTNDAYVSPIPHEHLLYLDKTALSAPLADSDTTVQISDAVNYGMHSHLNTFRIDDELITFGTFDPASMTLTGCVRGAFGTTACAHEKGASVRRLVDHDYKVFFPDFSLQPTLARDLGVLLRDCGVRKFSFDGLEGTVFSGHGDYARNAFVKQICDIVGPELLCDGSNITHYLWHAFSYCNWGEPWYDDDHRGGMYAARMQNQRYFRRNLLPRMLGWYQICLSEGRWEATTPETMEFILSRSAVFDAGAALSFPAHVMKRHGLTGAYLDLMRIWGDFRLHAQIPDDVRERMENEHSNWHLEYDGEQFLLTELSVRHADLGYRDGITRTEAGYVGAEASTVTEDAATWIDHNSLFILDGAMPTLETPEAVHFRIRVGETGHGCMRDLDLWGRLRFTFCANGGDYLEYRGGNELYHLDANFNEMEVLRGEGSPIEMNNNGIYNYIWGFLRYRTDDDPIARYTITEIRQVRRYKIERKA